MSKVVYEWDFEVVDKNDDVVDHNFYDTLPENRCLEENERLVLVRDEVCESLGVVNRTWAYLEKGLLPNTFDNGVKVPKKYIKEVSQKVRM